MLKKIVEYNSSTSQEITVSCVKALKSIKHTQSVIATLTDVPANLSPEAQPTTEPTQNIGGSNKEQAGEHTKA